jgi:hypothetical protein
MARTLAQIKESIKTKARTYTSLDDLLFANDSGAIQGSIFISLVETFAAAQQSLELIADQVASDLQTIADAAPSGNAAWIRARVLEFQNGDVITIDPVTFVPSYAVFDATKQIVTRCSVTQTATATVQIKVAKNEPPEPLSVGELAALRAYYFGSGTTQGIGFAGVRAVIQSNNPDRIYVEGVIRYLGQYDPAVVKTNVIAAIEAFLFDYTSINFDGTIKMQELEDAILLVEGVSRFEFAAADSIRVRNSATSFASATTVSTEGQYKADAGYIIQEDTAGQTFTDKITTSLESTL